MGMRPHGLPTRLPQALLSTPGAANLLLKGLQPRKAPCAQNPPNDNAPLSPQVGLENTIILKIGKSCVELEEPSPTPSAASPSRPSWANCGVTGSPFMPTQARNHYGGCFFLLF